MTDLFEHAATGGNLLHNAVIKDGLGEHGQSPVLGLNAELLGLEIDVNIGNLFDAAALCFCTADDPTAELVVGTVATRVVFAIFISTFVKGQGLLEVVRKLLCASLHGGFRSIHSPLDAVLIGNGTVQILGFGVDAASQLIVTACFKSAIFVCVRVVGIAALGRGMSISIGVCISIFLGLGTTCFLVRLVFLAFFWLRFDDEAAQLQTKVYIRPLAAGFAILENAPVLDDDVGFGILALLAKHEFGDESIQMVLKLGCFMGSVDDPAIVCWVCVRLSAKFEAKVLDEVW